MNKKLVAAYKKMINNKTKSGFRKKDHDEYVVEAKKYLKNNFEDRIEQGKLMIKLYREVNNKK